MMTAVIIYKYHIHYLGNTTDYLRVLICSTIQHMSLYYQRKSNYREYAE
jgi:hypothetical protein